MLILPATPIWYLANGPKARLSLGMLFGLTPHVFLDKNCAPKCPRPTEPEPETPNFIVFRCKKQLPPLWLQVAGGQGAGWQGDRQAGWQGGMVAKVQGNWFRLLYNY